MQDIYKKIKQLREERGLSQEELAKLTGYTSRSSIAKIEKGEVDLTQSKILLFAKAFNTSPSYLMGWEDNLVSDWSLLDNEEEYIISAYRKSDPLTRAMVLRALGIEKNSKHKDT